MIGVPYDDLPTKEAFLQLPKQGWSGWIFPAIKRAPDVMLVAEQLVAVQPMNVQAGAVMYMDMVYGPRVVNPNI